MEQLEDQTSLAYQACSSCKRQKRRCDKLLPSCSLCRRVGRSCEYSPGSSNSLKADEILTLQKRICDLENQRTSTLRKSRHETPFRLGNSTPEAVAPEFPGLFFLDSFFFTVCKGPEARYRKPAILAPDEILNLLGGDLTISRTLHEYFTCGSHKWLPIISKARLTQKLDRPSMQLDSDVILLLLAIRLIETRETESPLYAATKSYLAHNEAHNVLSIHLIQAATLVAAFETGHAIYPAAYLSIGKCVTLAYAVGLNDRHGSPQLLEPERRWTEQEERRRVWWAIMLLERYIGLGNAGRPLMTVEPSTEESLPTEDEAWDNGDLSRNDGIALSHTTDIQASPFARTCQAAYLVGSVQRHIIDRTTTLGDRFQNALQLHKTLLALTNLLSVRTEGQLGGFQRQMWTAIALCYSALMQFYDAYSCTEHSRLDPARQSEMQAIASDGLKNTSRQIVLFSQSLDQYLQRGNSNQIGYLVTDCLYAGAATLAWYNRENRNEEAMKGCSTIKNTLRTLAMRWNVAEVYNKEIEDQEVF